MRLCDHEGVPEDAAVPTTPTVGPAADGGPRRTPATQALTSGAARIRVPRTALVACFFLFLCVTPLAFYVPWMLLAYFLPAAALLWVLRAGVDVGPPGVTARALLVARNYPWEIVRGLLIGPRGDLRLVLADGSRVRLPVARARHLPMIAGASGGRLPVEELLGPDSRPTADQ